MYTFVRILSKTQIELESCDKNNLKIMLTIALLLASLNFGKSLSGGLTYIFVFIF